MLVIIQSSQPKSCRAIPLTQMRVGIVTMAMAKSAVMTPYSRGRMSSILVVAATAAAVVGEASWWLKDGGLGTPSLRNGAKRSQLMFIGDCREAAVSRVPYSEIWNL